MAERIKDTRIGYEKQTKKMRWPQTGVGTNGLPLIDLSHNCARDPEKNRANASVGQKNWREPRVSSLFVCRNKRWRPCRLHFSGCSCAGIPIFQLRIASMSGQS